MTMRLLFARWVNRKKYKQLSSDTRAIDWKNTVISSFIEDVIETNKQHN